MTQAQANKHASQVVEDDTKDEECPANTRRVVVEDLGGAPVHPDGNALPADARSEE